MLRTNLSTRPFYNSRVVQVVLVGLALLVAGFTAYNVVEVLRLNATESTVGARAEEAEQETARLRREADRIRRQINPDELEAVASAAREANRIIDQRTFSWTDLLSRFEATLPEAVRIRSVQPRHQGGDVVVRVTVHARRAEDLDAFVEALEQGGGFRDVLPIEVRPGDEDLLEGTIEGLYMPIVAAAGETRP